ncbi:DNA-directed RNA polymerase subunit alpha, partial [Patescibacteria group bacterium]|nr:DNA-directed RNA polymerase subunit alpha [Patescibacteria group bacterium]
GIFEIEALYPGYGVTIGNSLRRVLLSSLEGAAVTQVKIKGVGHEFSSIEGVQEDVITIILQLKKLRFLMHTSDPQTAILKIKGEKQVRGSDFKLPSQVELINKDLPIAQITTKQTELEMEIQIEKGIGYVPAEERKTQKEEIGTISLDAIFTPIRKVSYRVENMRVGERTNFDRLTLEIETDGTMDSEEALRQAASILIEQYTIVFDGLEEQKLPLASKEAATKKEKLPLKKAVNKTATTKAAAKK